MGRPGETTKRIGASGLKSLPVSASPDVRW